MGIINLIRDVANVKLGVVIWEKRDSTRHLKLLKCWVLVHSPCRDGVNKEKSERGGLREATTGYLVKKWIACSGVKRSDKAKNQGHQRGHEV